MRPGSAALLLCLVLAGCTAQGGGDATTSELRVRGTHQGDGIDAIVRGTVLDHEGFAVDQARIIILSVSHSVETDLNGSFVIEGVDAGPQVIRVEKQGYHTVVKHIEIKAGSIVQVEAVLVPVDNLNPGFRRAHVHNLWHGRDRYTFFDQTISWPNQQTLPPQECGVVAGNMVGPRWCHFLDVAPETGRLIPPGTKALAVTADFEYTLLDNPAVPESVGLFMYPPTEGSDFRFYTAPLVPGQTAIVEVDPEYADPGHSLHSSWHMMVYYGSSMPTGATYNSLKSDIGLKIEAIRGDLVIDPPHPRFWLDDDVHTLPKVENAVSSSVQFSPKREPHPQYCYGVCMTFVEGGIIPPGATRMEIDFTYTLYDPPATAAAAYEQQGARYILGVKDASKPRGGATWDDFTFPTPTTSEDHPNGYGQTLHYSLDLANMGTDQFYDKRSGWRFSVAAEGMEHEEELPMCDYYLCGAYLFQLEAVAINEKRDQQIDAGLA